MGLLQQLDREPLGRRGQLVAQFVQGLRAPVPRAIEQDADSLELGGVVADEAGEGLQVVLGLVLLARGPQIRYAEETSSSCSMATRNIRLGRG